MKALIDEAREYLTPEEITRTATADQAGEQPDPWKVLTDFLSPEGHRAALIRGLHVHQRWIGALKAVQTTFPDDPGLVASCRALVHCALVEIERIQKELKRCR